MSLLYSSSSPNWWSMKTKFHSHILCWLMSTSITTSILIMISLRTWLGTWKDGNFHSIDTMLIIRAISKLWLKFFLKETDLNISSWNKSNLLLFFLLENSLLSIHWLLIRLFQGCRNLKIFLFPLKRNLYFK